MHSFLIVGNNSEIVENKISELLKKYSLKRIDFDGQKIEEIRKLNSFTSLSLKDKTAIVITNIEKSTNEAANAFLKSLEEPQDNLYFLLTTSSIHKVLPTIISRCQIIYVSQKRVPEDVSNLEKFLNMKPSEKLFFLERIKKRDEAIYFFENLMFFIHQKIKEDEVNLNIFSKILETAQETLSRLEKNGNVNIQLTYFVVNTDNFDSSTHLGHEV